MTATMVPPVRTPVTTRASDARDTRRFETRNDLPEATRREVIELLNQRLADAIDLQLQCKQAHWNVKGPQFIALHQLFDEIHAGIGEYVDLLAERVVQLGGVAEGTLGVAADRSTLMDYPLGLVSGAEHVAALADVLAQFGREMRMGIEELAELKDAGSTDLFTGISRGLDKWLWFVESHQLGA